MAYCGQECPIALDPGSRQQQKGLKEYVSKKQSESKPGAGESLTNNNSIPSEVFPAPIPVVVYWDGPESEEETIPLRPYHKPLASLKIDTTKSEITHPAAPDSPPDSPFNINCRCGLKGDGNLYYDEKEGEAVLCTDCEHWSHIACQRNGQASKLRVKEVFFCDFCQVQVPGMGKSEKDHAAEQRCVFILFAIQILPFWPIFLRNVTLV